VPVPPSFATPANPFGQHMLAGAMVLPAPETGATESAPAPRTNLPAAPLPETRANPPSIPAPELKPNPPVMLAPVEPRTTLPAAPPPPVEPVLTPQSESNLWHPARRPQPQEQKSVVPAKLELESEVPEVPPPPLVRPW
jgi:hypothetical protein